MLNWTMQVNAIHTDIWSVPSPMRLLGFDMQRTSVVVRHGATFTLISPTGRIDFEGVRKLGEIGHIVAPTRFHDTGMSAAARAFPEAQLWGVSGLDALLPSLSLQELRADRLPREWDGQLRCFRIDGMPKVNEHVIWHRPSATLITSDLIFNIVPPADPWTKFFFKLNGAWERPSPTHIFRACIKDKAAFRTSIQNLRGLPTRCILPAHGAVITEAEAIAETLARLEAAAS